MTPFTPALEMRLLNDFQSGFPLVRAPYAALAEALQLGEADVIASLGQLVAAGKVSRVGAVFRPGAIGVSTLAAMAAPADGLDRIARIVSARPEVNHNYEREHRYNLWFVVTAADAAALARTLAAIARDARLFPLSLPLVDDYWIDLSFDLGADRAHDRIEVRRRIGARPAESPASLSYADRALVSALEHGLPLVPRPYARLAQGAGMSEVSVLARLAEWLNRGIIKRLGVVVRHRALGYTANAMCVWDVPDADVTALGEALALEAGVTLCYRRERALPQWPYNLFCMIHGRDRATVTARLAQLAQSHRLGRYAHAVLFSRQAFKQRGARYGLMSAAGAVA
ncbi:MAG: Lrp/AsnC family transcriptional regulator [Aromatoleum sp.]|nr:Lrp/AsnC family transcriptional regulator [Aromatoleum sp.]